MKKNLGWLFLFLLMSSCSFFSELWSPSDVIKLQTDSRGTITFQEAFVDPSTFVGKISQTLVVRCHATSDFAIKRATLDLTPLIGEKVILPQTSSDVWSTNMNIYPLSEGSFQLELTLSNEKGRVVTNQMSVSVKDQTIIYVAPYGKDYYEGLKEFPIASIGTAISNALGKSISTLYVAGGVYTNVSTSAVIWMKSWANLSLLGSWDSNFTVQQPLVSPSVIRGSGVNGSLAWISGCSNILLDGFDFVGGTNRLDNGGGMKVLSSKISLTRCRFISNYVTNNGGGLYAENSHLFLSNVNLLRNVAAIRGGGAYFKQSTGEFLNSLVYTNRAVHGAGLYIYNSGSSLVLRNLTFASNYAYPYEGGGIYLDQSQSVITQVVFVNNFAYGYGGAVFLDQSSPLLVKNSFSNNQTGSFGYGGAICMQNFSTNAKIIKNIFYQNNRYNISEYLVNGHETSPSELTYNQFVGMSDLYRDEDGGSVIHTLTDLNALDENGYNPSNSVFSNF